MNQSPAETKPCKPKYLGTVKIENCPHTLSTAESLQVIHTSELCLTFVHLYGMKELIHVAYTSIDKTVESNTAFVLPFFFSFATSSKARYQLSLYKNGVFDSNVNYIKIKKEIAEVIDCIPILEKEEFQTAEIALHINPKKESKVNFELIFSLKDKIIEKRAIARIDIQKLKKSNSYLAETLIVLPCYNPDKELFKRQISSIFNQVYTDWHLYIQDDHSDDYLWLEDYLKSFTDSKYSLFRNEKNIGFYHNIESLLNKAYGQSTYISLCDQDDYWYKDKLSTLGNEIKAGQAIYCDMRILSTNGDVICDSFWNGRSNHFKDPDALMLSNTMTGCASLFHNDQLSILLPFPTNIGNSFHDHWIALSSYSNDRLVYTNNVLQDYLQHDNNVTGYTSFKSQDKIKSILSSLSLQKILLQNKFFSSKQHTKVYQDYLKIYYNAFLKRKYYAYNLKARLNDNTFSYYLNNQAAKAKFLQFSMIRGKNYFTNNIETAMYNSLQYIQSLQ